jgi:hypothetical protein
MGRKAELVAAHRRAYESDLRWALLRALVRNSLEVAYEEAGDLPTMERHEVRDALLTVAEDVGVDLVNGEADPRQVAGCDCADLRVQVAAVTAERDRALADVLVARADAAEARMEQVLLARERDAADARAANRHGGA